MATPRKARKDYLPRGQPTKYRAEFCQAVMEHLKSGASFESFAAHIDVAPSVLYLWLKKHPDFLEARTKGEVLAEKFWADLGRAGAAGRLTAKTVRWNYVDQKDKDGNIVRGPDHMPLRVKVIESESEHPAAFNAASWKFFMQNRFGWTEKQLLEHTGKDGGPIEHDHSIDEETLADIAKALAPRES